MHAKNVEKESKMLEDMYPPQIQKFYYNRDKYIQHLVPGYNKKWLANAELKKALCEKLGGMSPTQAHTNYTKEIGKKYLKPVHEYISLLAYTQRRISFSKVREIHVAKPYLDQAMKDGLKHLTPLIRTYGRPPEEIKKVVGKSNWKKLSHNSFSRNLLIANRAKMIYFNIDKYIDMPSTLLKSTIPNRLLVEVPPRPWKHYTTSKMQIFKDTIEMARQLGKNPQLSSWEKINRLHEEYSEEILLKKDKLDKQPITEDLGEIVTDEFKATPLISPADLRLEGRKMHHCVASYTDRVRNGRYYVYHIESSGEKSTIGLCKSNDGSWIIDQHYGICNEQPEYNKKAEKLILSHMNTQQRRLAS